MYGGGGLRGWVCYGLWGLGTMRERAEAQTNAILFKSVVGAGSSVELIIIH